MTLDEGFRDIAFILKVLLSLPFRRTFCGGGSLAVAQRNATSTSTRPHATTPNANNSIASKASMSAIILSGSAGRPRRPVFRMGVVFRACPVPRFSA